MFDWDKFIKCDMAVVCFTEAESRDFLNQAKEKGLVKNPINHFWKFTNGVAYAYNHNNYGRLGFSYPGYYKSKGCEIVYWQQESNMED